MDLANGGEAGKALVANQVADIVSGKSRNTQENDLGSKLGTGSKSNRDMVFRADKIDFKSWDIQLEKHLSRAWSRDREVPAKKEEWEIDLSKLDIRYVKAHGTYGTIYRGNYDGNDVAVKVLDWGEDGVSSVAEIAALRTSFRQEVAVWHKLDHPNVAKFYGASMGTSNLKIPPKSSSFDSNQTFPSRACCVVVEYLPGGTLKSFLIKNRKRKLAFKVVIQLALDLSRGLSYLHSKKIVHRDIKTENVLLDAQKTLKIVDFGVARVEAQNPKDMTGETGTLGYMAPEVLDVVRQVHMDYLEAGADIIITASYQATIQGFESKGYTTDESESLLRKSVEIACTARVNYYDRCNTSTPDESPDGRIFKKRQILIAASVGSYGAYLADGSEYSGIYGDSMTLEALKEFHRKRVKVLAESGADLIAFETIPNKLEAKAYAELLEEENISLPAWFAFNSKDGIHVVSGDSYSECVSIAESCRNTVAVGINCTPPRFIHGLISSIKKVTTKPIVIYPNSGESYDADLKEWVQNTGVSDDDFVSYVNKWCETGASIFGGCCRTTPNTIRGIYRTLSKR